MLARGTKATELARANSKAQPAFVEQVLPRCLYLFWQHLDACVFGICAAGYCHAACVSFAALRYLRACHFYSLFFVPKVRELSNTVKLLLWEEKEDARQVGIDNSLWRVTAMEVGCLLATAYAIAFACYLAAVSAMAFACYLAAASAMAFACHLAAVSAMAFACYLATVSLVIFLVHPHHPAGPGHVTLGDNCCILY